MGELESVRRAMEAGISNGEWFEIVYHGGSNPGAKRKIAPIKVLGDPSTLLYIQRGEAIYAG